MKDWLILVGWLATAASFLLLSVLVLLPQTNECGGLELRDDPSIARAAPWSEPD
jgi:hypothetical protein